MSVLFTWAKRKWKVFFFKLVLRRMMRAMRKDDWDNDDIQAVLLHIGGEVDVLTPSVKERLGR